MSDIDLIKQFKKERCLHHQAKFAAEFFEPNSASKHLLIAEPWLGSRFTTSLVVRYAVSDRNAQRVLILCPSALAAQWQYLFQRFELNVPVIVVDRRKFRELTADQSTTRAVQSSSAIFVISWDLAKQADVSESLRSIQWDMLVIEGHHQLKVASSRYKNVDELVKNNPKTRMLMLTPIGANEVSRNQPLPYAVPSGTKTTIWTRHTVTDEMGKSAWPDIKFQWIHYRRTPEEVAVLSQLQKKVEAFGMRTHLAENVAFILLNSGSSSLFCLEQHLGRMSQKCEDGVQKTDDIGDLELDASPARNNAGLDLFNELRTRLAQLADELRPMFESVKTDSKCTALMEWLKQRYTGDGNPRICVLTQYADTAEFLSSTISELAPGVQRITGSSTAREREASLSKFSEAGGILVLTEASEMMVSEADVLFFYDFPLNPDVLDQWIGRFVRFGRTAPVLLIAFTDEAKVLRLEEVQSTILDFSTFFNDPVVDRSVYRSRIKDALSLETDVC